MKIRQIVKARLDEVFGPDNYRLIVVAIAGSHAYGMQTDDSDHDVMGLFLPPEDYILGMKRVEQVMLPKEDGVEGTVFAFSKWFQLMFAQNPNVLELLWHEQNMYVYRDEFIWPMLIEARKKLLSSKIKHSFGGYAFAQYQRLDKLNEKVNQNKKRLEEFEKFGYSTKNASHLMRLLNTCFDALVEGEIKVMRPERQQLIAIRQGQYTMEQLRERVDRKFDLIEQAYMNTVLPRSVDDKFANDLHKQILKKHLGM